jgi:hypothetical protein
VLQSIALAAFLVLPVNATVEGPAAERPPVCRGQVAGDVADLRGPVLHVLDGARLCVAMGPDPSEWVALRLADAPEGSDSSRGALMAASFGQDVVCRLVGRDDEGAVAICRTSKGALGAQLAAPRIIRAGQAWR